MNRSRKLKATRLADGPIISPATPGYDTDVMGTNINGPSLIRVPDFVADPLGKYYLYFAHHQGRFIRLAYADDPAGPWRVHSEPTLHIDHTPFNHHIASPDVHVDHEKRSLRMYYHGCCPAPPSPTGNRPHAWEQPSCLAFSDNGLTWTSDEEYLGESYFRVFTHNDWTYAIAKGGRLYRSRDGRTGFEKRNTPLDLTGRHFAILIRDGFIYLIYSRWGDRPERLLCAPMRLSDDWQTWRLTDRYELLRPEKSWEGAEEPLAVSLSGSVHHPVNELRDPDIFVDSDGTTYLVYSYAGETGLAIATVDFE